jgi:hypothetical protein
MKNILFPQRANQSLTAFRRRDPSHPRMVYLSVRIAAFFLVLLLPACGPAPQPASTTTPVPTGTPSNPDLTLTPGWTPTPGATEQPAPTQTASGLPANGLSKEGPWLLLNTDQGLWVANPDGTGGTVIDKTGPVLIPGNMQNAVSSAGGHIAFLTYTPGGNFNYRGLRINILTLPQTQTFLSIPLTTPDTEPPADNPSDINRAMTEHQSFAWSPDGKRLAYIGAAEGPSADLYEYFLDGGAVLRLTDGPDQAYDPVWSPDGTWIVHTAAAGFGTGAGIVVTGIYAARADDSGVISLYDIPKGSGGEGAVGWLNAHTLVTRTWYITCGWSDLRLTDLSLKKSDVVFKGCVTAAAAAEGGGSVLFAQSQAMAPYDPNPRLGMFFLTEADRKPWLVSNYDFSDIAWSAGKRSYLARATDGGLMYEVSPTGHIQYLINAIPQLPAVSPDGRYWAWDASLFSNTVAGLWIGGLWIGEYGRELRQVFPDEVAASNILWAPDGQSIYFLGSAGGLYRAQAPDWVPVLLAENLKPAGSGSPLAWVSG